MFDVNGVSGCGKHYHEGILSRVVIRREAFKPVLGKYLCRVVKHKFLEKKGVILPYALCMEAVWMNGFSLIAEYICEYFGLISAATSEVEQLHGFS